MPVKLQHTQNSEYVRYIEAALVMIILPVDEELFSIRFHAGVDARCIHVCVLQFLPLNSKICTRNTVSVKNFLELTRI